MYRNPMSDIVWHFATSHVTVMVEEEEQEMPTSQEHISENIARLNFRLPNEVKEMIERAAVVSGLTVTDFAINAMVNSANEVLERHQTRTLTDRDRDVFLALLDSDQEPNDALKKAAKDYKRYMKR